MSALDTLGIGELPDKVVAGTIAIEARFDAVAQGIDLRKFEIDFSGDPRDIESTNV
jgi:hypothetical protein